MPEVQRKLSPPWPCEAAAKPNAHLTTSESQMDGHKKPQLPIVVDYDITTGILSRRVDWKSTLKLLCPHCSAQLRTRYQGPSDPDDCPKCGNDFLISPKKLIAAIQRCGLDQQDTQARVAEEQRKSREGKEQRQRQQAKDTETALQCSKCTMNWDAARTSCICCGNELPPVRAIAIPPKLNRNEDIGAIAVIGLVFLGFFIWLQSASWSVSTSPPKTSKNSLVYNSYLDGSVHQVESWLRQNLKDPESLEIIEWYKVVDRKDGSFSVVVEYRARNGFGGFNVEKMKFYLDSGGKITDYSDY